MAQTIKCPTCKKEQPKQPICTHCGFDIRAYALSRQKQKSQPQEVTCPGCNGKVPKQSICTLCGFDIRAYALSLKSQKAPAPSITCPNCHEQTPQQEACKHCGYDIRMVGYSDIYHEHESYKPEIFSESVPSGPEPPISLKELFKRSLQRFRQRWATLIGLSLLSILFMLLGLLIPLFTVITLHSRFYQHSNLILGSGAILALVLSLLGMCWGLASMIAATVHPRNSLRDSLLIGRRFIISYIWTVLLASMVVAGGFSFFLIPGILFMVWAFAAQFIIFMEHERGMDALLKSRHYVRKHWGDTFIKLAAIFIVMTIASFIPLSQIVFLPFMLVYLHEMFEDLRRIKVDENPPGKSFMASLSWSAAGLMGFILPLVIIFMLTAPVFKSFYAQVSSGDLMLEQYIPLWMR